MLAVVVYTQAMARTAGHGRWGIHATVSIFAFLIWCYAIRAEACDILDLPFVGSVSGLLLGTFTLFSGFIVPVVEKATDGDECPDLRDVP